MAEYWRYQEREAAFPATIKRPRGEYDDLLALGGGLYPREEHHYGDQNSQFPWRDSEPLGVGVDTGRNGLSYAPGSDFSAGLMGGGAPGLGAGGLGMDPMLKPSSGLLNGGRPDHLSGQDNQVGRTGAVPSGATATLFVEGLPSDVSRREASHIFRPFIGFKEVRIVRKDSKRSGVDHFILCFVDFVDEKCASVALEALQGYKFDEHDGESETLKLQYARTPIRAGPRDGMRGGRERFGRP